ncbi:MAG: type II toxin-antitoxin system PemK/MazF family toxin [Gammaproteobacteria bacterium]|nr:type II toxin-antitoxin system PemK/MazF family toxin [Gammaproteobacteria bacterium]
MIYKPFSIVVLPFPFTDVAKSKKRPALMISTELFQKENGHATLLMITSAQHSEWFGDHLIADLKCAGLSVDSYVRQKIFTVDLRLIEKKIGMLSKEEIVTVKKILKKCIAI